MYFSEVALTIYVTGDYIVITQIFCQIQILKYRFIGDITQFFWTPDKVVI